MNSTVEKVLFVELLEKISRMVRFLNLEPDLARQQGVEVLDIFRTAVDGVLENLKPIAAGLSRGQEPDVWERLAVTRRLSDIMYSIDELHSQLQFIHGKWLRPETHVFIDGVLGFIPEERRPRKVSAILSNNYSFEESDLSSYFEYVLDTANVSVSFKAETPTVFLPKIERDNALNWSILVHECGHADREGIKKVIENPNVIPTNMDTAQGNRRLASVG